VDHTDEQLLIERARAGDRPAFARLVDVYWGRVFRWLRKMSHCAATAEDLTQDVFLRAWRGLGTWEPGTNFRAWLFRIAANRFLDSRRGPRAREPLPLTDTLPSRQSGPVSAVLSDEARSLMVRAVERLPLALRAVFLLRMQEKLPFADIAASLGIREATVRGRLFKARRHLLRDLRDYLDRAWS
jgi:RNA polymerase sigma-70 factor (ECF subfamily)